MLKKAANRLRLLKLVLLPFIFVACNSSIHIDGFSAEEWKADKNGCLQKRSKEIDILIDGKSNILGQSENEILSFLGKPDRNQLYSRNQKFFVYYIAHKTSCDSIDDTESTYLSIRINAIGVASEMFVYNSENELNN